MQIAPAVARDEDIELGATPAFAELLPGPRAWLRARPSLQGLVVAPSGVARRLPHAADAVYVLLYHSVMPQEVPGLRRHLTALLDRGRFVTWDEAIQALAGDAPLCGPTFCLTFDDAHKSWVDQVLPVLAEMNLTAAFFVRTAEVVAGTSESNLTWDDCLALIRAGMGVGSHTVTHRRLASLNEETVRRELSDSKDELEQRLGVPVVDFAAPYGLPGLDFGKREIDIAAELGYRTCASALPGRMTPGHSMWDLRRCGVAPAWPLAAVRRRVHE